MDEDKKPRLSIVVLFIMAVVLFFGVVTVHGCVDMDEALPHYRAN